MDIDRAGRHLKTVHPGIDGSISQTPSAPAHQSITAPSKRVSGNRQLDGGRNSVARGNRTSQSHRPPQAHRTKSPVEGSSIRRARGARKNRERFWRSTQRLALSRALEWQRPMPKTQNTAEAGNDWRQDNCLVFEVPEMKIQLFPRRAISSSQSHAGGRILDQ